MIINVPWAAWYGDSECALYFPDEWHVQVMEMSNAAAISLQELRDSICQPIGTLRLSELARRYGRAVIVVEDMTRPTPTELLLPIVLAELELGGVTAADTLILIGLGSHSPMSRHALIKKLGMDILARYAIVQHNPNSNLQDIGTSRRGTPIHINRFYMDAPLRVAIGSITPHNIAGFGGGGKLVSVGVAGIETMRANHARAVEQGGGCSFCIEGNECRADLDDIAQQVGLDFVVNGVVNSHRQLAGVFSGDPRLAHLAGVQLARELYQIPLPPLADVVVLNAYPKDTDLVQAGNAYNAVGFDLKQVLRDGGTAVLSAACPEGLGIHYLTGVGFGSSRVKDLQKDLGGHRVLIHSPNLSPPEARQLYPSSTLVLGQWDEVLEELARCHGSRPSVSVFPCASLQIPGAKSCSEVVKKCPDDATLPS